MTGRRHKSVKVLAVICKHFDGGLDSIGYCRWLDFLVARVVFPARAHLAAASASAGGGGPEKRRGHMSGSARLWGSERPS